MRRWLVISNVTGQLGNRLVVWAHLLGAAYERGWQVWNPAFLEYSPDFAATCAGPGPASRRLRFWAGVAGYKASQLLHRVPGSPIGWAKAADTLHYDLGELMDRAEARGWRVVFTKNYHFRQHAWCARHAARIRALLTPVPAHCRAAEAAVAAARDGAEVLIGVHVRHGDYRHHLGGRFYYEPAVYRELMASAAALHPGRTVRFLVCSNGSVGPADFAGLDARMGPGAVVPDMHALSLCDAVMGPPSSFSAWAAFHGDRPYWMIEEPRPADASSFRLQPSPDPKY